MTPSPQSVDLIHQDRCASDLFARAVEKNRFLDVQRFSNVSVTAGSEPPLISHPISEDTPTLAKQKKEKT